MKPIHRPRWIAAALALAAGAAVAAPPRDVMVTREVQDLYRVASGTFYIKTTGCSEQVFGDRANLRMYVATRGGMLTFRNGRMCTVDKLLREVDPSQLGTTGGF